MVDENTNQAQQVQFINGQPHLVVQDENGQSAVLDGQQLVVEDENGEQMVIGGEYVSFFFTRLYRLFVLRIYQLHLLSYSVTKQYHLLNHIDLTNKFYL